MEYIRFIYIHTHIYSQLSPALSYFSFYHENVPCVLVPRCKVKCSILWRQAKKKLHVLIETRRKKAICQTEIDESVYQRRRQLSHTHNFPKQMRCFFDEVFLFLRCFLFFHITMCTALSTVIMHVCICWCICFGSFSFFFFFNILYNFATCHFFRFTRRSTRTSIVICRWKHFCF